MKAPALRTADAPDAARLLAVVRVAAIPIVLLGERLVDHPEAASGAFEELLALYALYATVSLFVVLRRDARHLGAGRQLELVAGHARPCDLTAYRGFDPEVRECLDECLGDTRTAARRSLARGR